MGWQVGWRCACRASGALRCLLQEPSCKKQYEPEGEPESASRAAQWAPQCGTSELIKQGLGVAVAIMAIVNRAKPVLAKPARESLPSPARETNAL